MRCRYPQPLKVVCFVENSLSFNQLNISRADIPCILGNGTEGATRPTQPVTLYITVSTTAPDPYDGPQKIPTEDVDSPAEETSPTEDFLFTLDRADEATKFIVPIDRSTTWGRAVKSINWVMDTLSPIAEVRVMPLLS